MTEKITGNNIGKGILEQYRVVSVEDIPKTEVNFLASCNNCKATWKEKGEYIGTTIPSTPRRTYLTCSLCDDKVKTPDRNITRFEVIDFTNEEDPGRVLVIRGDLTIQTSYQDDNKTVKIFISQK